MNQCPICESKREKCFQAQILNKYNVQYFFCKNCGFLQTQEPHWLDEAYSSAIAVSDVGIIARNIAISKKLACILYLLFDKDGKYLDIAGGYGLLTRMMRDIGFDFYWSDLYCQNMFAREFEVENTSKQFSAITAFEVLEHIYQPIDFLTQSLKKAHTSTIIFSTELFFGQPAKPSEWWYYSLETGQHISFYQYSTLEFIAKRLSLNLYSYSNLHILTDKAINTVLWKLAVSRLSRLIQVYVKKRLTSKTFQDYEKIKQKLI